MVRGIFYGSVRLDYAEKRHPLWIDAIRSTEARKEECQENMDGTPEVSNEVTPVAETPADGEAIISEEEKEPEQ
jgi:hypothetical protein